MFYSSNQNYSQPPESKEILETSNFGKISDVYGSIILWNTESENVINIPDLVPMPRTPKTKSILSHLFGSLKTNKKYKNISIVRKKAGIALAKKYSLGK